MKRDTAAIKINFQVMNWVSHCFGYFYVDDKVCQVTKLQ